MPYYGEKPKVSLSADEIDMNKYEFRACGESENGIEFYSWDFNHKADEGFKADVILDKAGRQTKAFETGKYTVAVEAVDKNGMSGTDSINVEIRDEKNDKK